MTSSKSVSTTPLATKRGPQCAIAALSKGSDDMQNSSWWNVRRALARFFVAAVPWHVTPRRPVHQQFEADAKGRKQQYADEGLVVMI